MMDISIKTTRSEEFRPILLTLGENLARLNDLKKKETNYIDLGEINWVSPLSILPLAAFLRNKVEKKYPISIIYPEDRQCSTYLKTIRFYKGISSAQELKKQKSYIPIAAVSGERKNIRQRDLIISYLAELLLKSTGCKKGLANALSYPITEMFDNIWEHSKSPFGWFLAQYYKNKRYMDICILDTGISIMKSYENSGHKIENDIDALRMSIEGISTKKEERGFGLPTTRNLVTRSEFHGKFLLLSGNAGHYASQDQSIFFNTGWHWQGTIIAIRINKVAGVDIYKYIE